MSLFKRWWHGIIALAMLFIGIIPMLYATWYRSKNSWCDDVIFGCGDGYFIGILIWLAAIIFFIVSVIIKSIIASVKRRSENKNATPHIDSSKSQF